MDNLLQQHIAKQVAQEEEENMNVLSAAYQHDREEPESLVKEVIFVASTR